VKVLWASPNMTPEEHAQRLVKHSRWRWQPGMILVWPSLNTQLIVLGVTPHQTLFVNFMGQTSGVELDPSEHGLYPDLTHPAMIGILLSLWLRWSPQAWVSICRWAQTGDPPKLEELLPKRWSITLDLDDVEEDPSGSYLGTALAQMLLKTWERHRMSTPLSIPKPELPHRKANVNGERINGGSGAPSESQSGTPEKDP